MHRKAGIPKLPIHLAIKSQPGMDIEARETVFITGVSSGTRAEFGFQLTHRS